MTFITYLAEDNDVALNGLIETPKNVADIKVVTHSATQAEATRWFTLQDSKQHLDIVDPFLQKGSGLDILIGCCNREPRQKVVLLTNDATPEIRKWVMALGGVAVFGKSTQVDALLTHCTEHTASVKSREVQDVEHVGVACNEASK